ncbi:MFS transporter [Candidatus Poribacteria bacterium]|nr:MFS transporter [Candidatus Poribacteria bacterium]
MTMSISKRPRVFYGYWVLLVAFLSIFISAGCGVGIFSLFVNSLQAEFGWGRGEIMVAFTIFSLLTGLAAPFVGGLIDRYGVRRIISLGAFLLGLGFISLNFIQSLWHFYGAYTIVGIGTAGIGQVSASTIVSYWFKKRLGTALGIMSTGMGAGVLVMAPLIGSYFIPNWGWRASYLTLAIFAWVLIPLALLVARTKPADMGLCPDGITVSGDIIEAKSSYPASTGFSLKIALGTSAFWLIGIIFFINSFASLGIFQNQVPHLQDIGFSLSAASIALTVIGLGSAIGKFVFGWLCDRIQAKYACAISFVLLEVATIILMCVRSTSPIAILWLYATLQGLGNGGWLPTMSMLININFGLTSYGTIFGVIILFHSIGCAIGPFLAGYMYDTMNTYYWTFVMFLASYAVAIPLVLAIRRPK